MSLAGVRAITFDAGGTLIEPGPSVGHIYPRIAAENGCPGISEEVLNRRFADAWRSLSTFDYSRDSWARVVDTTFAGLTAEPPSQTFFASLYAAFAAKTAWRIFDDVLPALDTLASLGFKLGVISNWDERLQPLLRELGLGSYFDAVLVSCEVGFCKPSPVIFNHAAEKLGLPPVSILHVGDQFEEDVRGATAAGFGALELRRTATHRAAGQVRSLLDLVEGLQNGSVN